jgi:hypothetical protein
MAGSLSLMTPGTALLLAIDGKGLGREGGHLSFIYSTSQQTRDRASSPVLTPSGPATPISGTSFTVLPAFPSAAAGEGQGHLSCSHDPRISSSPSPPATGVKGQASVRESLLLWNGRQIAGPALPCSHLWGQLTPMPTIRNSSIVLPG